MFFCSIYISRERIGNCTMTHGSDAKICLPKHVPKHYLT